MSPLETDTESRFATDNLIDLNKVRTLYDGLRTAMQSFSTDVYIGPTGPCQPCSRTTQDLLHHLRLRRHDPDRNRIGRKEQTILANESPG